ncbi:MAG TPA: hypothetical protein VGI10_07745 [Polyangiaceae bacterium]
MSAPSVLDVSGTATMKLDLDALNRLFAGGNNDEVSREALLSNLVDHAADLLQILGYAFAAQGGEGFDENGEVNITWRLAEHLRASRRLIESAEIEITGPAKKRAVQS